MCVIVKLRHKVCESFYTMSSAYHRASSRHLGSMNVLVLHACGCGPACMRYISGEVNSVCVWIQIHKCTFPHASAYKSSFFLSSSFSQFVFTS